MEVGKLYTCEEYHLLFYPDQETAAGAAEIRRTSAAAAAGSAAFWSNQLGKPVSYAEKNVPLLVLNSKDKCVEVLAGDRKGWIVYRDWLEIKEIP